MSACIVQKIFQAKNNKTTQYEIEELIVIDTKQQFLYISQENIFNKIRWNIFDGKTQGKSTYIGE